ncbi:MAG: ABC transporter permease [Bdellovibrionales bacterium]
MTKLAKYFWILRTTVRSKWAYPLDLLASTSFLAVILFVFVHLWRISYQDHPQIEGFSFAMIIWYYVGTESIIMALPFIHRIYEREIKEGDVAVQLNKPYQYLIFHGATYLAEALSRVVFLLLVGCSIAYFMAGPISFNWYSLPALALVYVVTVLLHFLYNSMIGLSAFWTEDVTGLFFIFDRAKWLLGGFLLPVSFFPEPLKSIAESLPFRWMINEPAMLFVNFSSERLVRVLSHQVALFVILAILAQGIYQLGVRRLNVNGG